MLKKQQPRQNLNVMGKAFSMLVKMCGISAKGNLFRLALAVVEGISAGAIKLNAGTADKFKRVDAELKDLAVRGTDALGEVSTDLGTELLALVNGAKTETPRIADAKLRFLDNHLAELSIEDINFGPDNETLSTVSKIIVEELRRVTDKLDLFVRSTDQNAVDIYQLTPSLEQIASTLAVVGMADNRASILGQVEIIKQLETDARGPSEDQLLEMARAFLEIESSLTLTIGEADERGEGDNFDDVNQAMAAVILETRNTLEIVKDQVVEFIASDFDLSKIQAVPKNLRSLAGGLRVINQQRACNILDATADYVEKDLLEEQCRPDLSQMEDLADAITSVDYYLERLFENAKDPYLQMIEVAESAIEKLGYAVDRFASEGSLKAHAGHKPSAGDDDVDKRMSEENETSVESLDEMVQPLQQSETHPAWDPTLDEIFVVEAKEKIAIIKKYAAGPGDITPDVIAAFHTLKGIAGMAGVISIARLAAPMEKWSSDLFLISAVASVDYIRFVNSSVDLMEDCLNNLDEFRYEMPGVDALLSNLSEIDETDATEASSFFNFENIRVLGKPRDIIEDWNVSQVGTVVRELKDVQAQASELKQVYLGEMVAALLTVYGNLSVRPNSEIRSRLIAAHEQLILMFDCVAASQAVNPAPEVVRSLGSIDFAALKREQEREGFVDVCRELLLKWDGSLYSWSQNINDETSPMPERKILAALLEKLKQPEHDRPSFGTMASVVEYMIELCDLVSANGLRANRDDLRLLASGRRLIEDQLQAYQAGEQPEEARALLGEFRNRSEALAMSTDMLLAVEVETGTEKIETIESAGTGIQPEDDIDLDVLALFLEEAEDLIEGIDQSILEWSENTADIAHLENILRLLHTIKGGARLTGLNSLGEFTHNFETDLMRLQTSPTSLDDHFFTSVNERQDEITRRIGVFSRYAEGAALEKETSAMQQAKSLAVDPAQTDATVSANFIEPASADSDIATGANVTAGKLLEDDVDLDILPIFIEEAEELLESIDQSILDWSGKRIDHTYLSNLLRHLHTLKGGAKLAGLNRLGEYTHNLETFLTGLQQNPVEPSSDFFTSLNRHQDEITRRVAIYKKISEGSAGADEVLSLSNSADFSDSLVQGDTTDFAQTQDRSATSRSPAPDEEAAERAPAPSQEIVRVSAELLDELVSLAGETSITRGRIAQQITDFGESLEEMEETIVRIREQVRRLEIEAESRETVFRSQSEDADAGFDELELDRYTMLQEISRSLSEGSSDMMDLKDTLLDKSRDAETLLHQQARLGSELQEGLTRTRMVSFARLIPRLRRIVRQISVEVGKSVKFEAFNVEGELDRSVLERIIAPLEHMLRNAVDHGIEPQSDRIAANKSETGRISLRLSREGGHVVLTVSDDGGGIDVDAVKKKALERGLISSVEQVSDQEAMQFIVGAGFSTAQKLTQISGRGVGMDVVNSEIKQLGGSLYIDSTLGVGTEFSIRIPFTVSINRALMVVIQEETYAVPLNTIEGIVRVSPYELETYYQPDAPMFEYAGQPYKLIYTGNLLSKSEKPSFEGQTSPLPVMLARSGDLSVALQVDKVIGSREVVVKALGRQFDKVGGISGATVLGDGSVVVILDVLALVQSVDAQAEHFVSDEPPADDTGVKTVMIVDDSVTVRKVTSRLMERQGWKVVTAKDGLDAVEQLQDIYPDIVLLDIEMPKMDGFEVLRTARRDARLKNLPIIMITSRTGEKHKQQAFALGVNAYLGKPFQEAGLMSTIEEVLAETKAQVPNE
ncbi:MAG: Hpt domain-containing protein [Pseudomonadales bacterium]|nr:Hpt domain-containing protein [Pseudomonadales bacterium]